MDYIDFLKSKIDIAPATGLNIDPKEVNPVLKPHERDAVVWLIRGGRRAGFEAFGFAANL
jgi:hypothetical protein